MVVDAIDAYIARKWASWHGNGVRAQALQGAVAIETDGSNAQGMGLRDAGSRTLVWCEEETYWGSESVRAYVKGHTASWACKRVPAIAGEVPTRRVWSRRASTSRRFNDCWGMQISITQMTLSALGAERLRRCSKARSERRCARQTDTVSLTQTCVFLTS